MAQDFDDGSKTEDPSQRKLQRARDQGQIAQSREVNTWFMLAASALLLTFLAPSIARTLGRSLSAFADPQRFIQADGILWEAVGADLQGVVAALVLPLAILMLAAAAGSLAQTGFVFATEKIGFDFSHISPAAGVKRLFAMRNVVELLKSIAKLLVVACVTGMLLRGEIDRIPLVTTLAPEDMLGQIMHLVMRLLTGILVVLSMIAGVDYLYQRLNIMRSLRMSKRELRDEMKQADGDPLIKARLRQIRTERSRRRMMAAVPGASVVITNPTHFAVALKYEMGAAGAPRVVAKGADLIAKRIRDIAEENDVPIVENPPLARALFAGVDIDSEISPEHYKAVAEIIGYVFRLKGKIRPRAATV